MTIEKLKQEKEGLIKIITSEEERLNKLTKAIKQAETNIIKYSGMLEYVTAMINAEEASNKEETLEVEKTE